MPVDRVCAALVALSCAWLPLAAQGGGSGLASSVVKQLDAALEGTAPQAQADALWQAAAAEHGECTQLVAELRARIAASDRAPLRRVLCGVLRYQGRPRQALRAL